ncbi:MAG: hypothetical protein RL367_877, partial [Pseudomonadota bacterium]
MTKATSAAKATPAVSRLRLRMIEDMTLRNMALGTQKCYLHAVKKLSCYSG